jgi:hypothetical protein
MFFFFASFSRIAKAVQFKTGVGWYLYLTNSLLSGISYLWSYMADSL